MQALEPKPIPAFAATNMNLRNATDGFRGSIHCAMRSLMRAP